MGTPPTPSSPTAREAGPSWRPGRGRGGLDRLARPFARGFARATVAALRASGLRPETPTSPERRFTSSSSRSTSSPSARIRCTSSPGSRSPERVAMGTPPAGVKPMVVSTGRPSRTATRLDPEPRCIA